MTSLILRIMLVLSLGWPNLTGLATHYDARQHAGRFTRSGEVYEADSCTCAVDVSLYPALAGKTLLVATLDRDNVAHIVTLRVNDSGYLYAAGRFVRGVNHWKPNIYGDRIVLDIPEGTFRKLRADGDTLQVAVWIIQEDR